MIKYFAQGYMVGKLGTGILTSQIPKLIFLPLNYQIYKYIIIWLSLY